MLFAIYLLRRKKGASNPQSLWLNPEVAGGLKDLDDKFIDFYHQVLTKYVAHYRNLEHANRKNL
ncbi:MAG: hypothetical protein IPG07_19350 [Crocinitomicaceae bacterium]|nr:hypothetical protein [Crocinitomicaceae bacterium]